MSTTQLRTGAKSRATTRCLFVLFRISDILFKLGVFLVLAGASLTGYGCSCPCGSTIYNSIGPCAATPVPNGACYARVAYVPMASCSWFFQTCVEPSIYIIHFILFMYLRLGNHLKMFCKFASFSWASANTVQVCCCTSILLIIFFQCWSRCARDGDAEPSGDLPMALDSLGTIGTLAAGFVMYNITTFNTETCRLQCYIISMLRVWVRLMIPELQFLQAQFQGGGDMKLCKKMPHWIVSTFCTILKFFCTLQSNSILPILPTHILLYL